MNISTKVISMCLAASLTLGGATTAMAAGPGNGVDSRPEGETPPVVSSLEMDRQSPSWGTAENTAGQSELPEGEAPDGERPELPEGETPDGERPELPEGEAPDGQPPALPQGEAPDGRAPQMGEQSEPGGQGDFRELIEQLLHIIYELYGGQSDGGWMRQPDGQLSEEPQSGMPSMDQPAQDAWNTGSQEDRAQAPELQQLHEQDFREDRQTAQQEQPSQDGRQNGQQNSGQQNSGQPGGPGGDSSAPDSYQAAASVTEGSEGQTYVSSGQSENAVLVDGKTVTIQGATIQKTGDTSQESADFYGTNAAVLANNGAGLTISGAEITTDGAHANGVFSYGSGTSVTISDSTITTTGNNSGGLMTTGGAEMTANDLTVITTGNSSAAIRSDRGGGTVNVTAGSYSSSGMGSPAIYSTADITVSDATLTASASEAVVIEGGNTVTLNNAVVSGSNTRLNGQSTVKTNVLIYQSMSGDASEGASAFTMNGGSMTAGTGSMFHVTNATTTINLSGVDFTYAEDSDSFLILSADAWGTAGKNGGNATVNLDRQTAEGRITVDSVSSLALNLGGGSSYTGAVNPDGASGSVQVILESGSTWILTGDSYVSSLEGEKQKNILRYR